MAQTNLHTVIPEIWNTDDHKDRDVSCKPTVLLLIERAGMVTSDDVGRVTDFGKVGSSVSGAILGREVRIS